MTLCCHKWNELLTGRKSLTSPFTEIQLILRYHDYPDDPGFISERWESVIQKLCVKCPSAPPPSRDNVRRWRKRRRKITANIYDALSKERLMQTPNGGLRRWEEMCKFIRRECGGEKLSAVNCFVHFHRYKT